MQLILFSVNEAVGEEEDLIWNIWKVEWAKNKICNYQKYFDEVKTEGYLHGKITRRKGVILNRIRLSQIGLAKIGLYPTGNCNVCGRIQDIEHFIHDCIETEDLRKQLLKYSKNSYMQSIDTITEDKSLAG